MVITALICAFHLSGQVTPNRLYTQPLTSLRDKGTLPCYKLGVVDSWTQHWDEHVDIISCRSAWKWS